VGQMLEGMAAVAAVRPDKVLGHSAESWTDMAEVAGKNVLAFGMDLFERTGGFH